jgi:hypothetical protein
LHPFRKLQKFAGLSGVRRRLFLEAVFELTRAQLSAALIPFRWLAPGFGRLMAESPEIYDATHERAILDLRWAIGTAASQLPWHSRCLVRATAVKWMLCRRRIPSTLYLGVAPGTAKTWDAHAWVRCGTIVLTGGPQHLNYRVLVKFADFYA